MGRTSKNRIAPRKVLSGLISNLIVWCISLMVLMPMAVVIINSVKTKTEAATMTLALPKHFQWSNFATVIDKGKLGTSFLNSFMYATLSVILIVLLVSAASFVLSRRRSFSHKFIYYFILLGIAMPINNIVLMKLMKSLHLINTQTGIILLYAALNIPLSLFLSYGYISTIPREMDEAAVIDGCGAFALFGKIILPLLKPIMATVFVLNFMSVWNDFTLPLYFLNDSNKWPMTLAVYNFFGMFEKQWNLVSADVLLTTLPVMIVFILGQKYIIGGVTAGAVKG